MKEPSSKPLISIKNLSISFLSNKQIVNAVSSISFDVLENEILGIVGESGSGKSVTALAILKLLPKNKTILEGSINYQNNNLLDLEDIEIRKIRGKDIAIIFQEPMSALNPTMRCVDQLRECIKEVHIDKKGQRYRNRFID